MTRLETFVAASAVIVLGLVTSLNVLDQGTLNQITKHPYYQQIFGDTADAPKAASPAKSTVASKAAAPKAVAPAKSAAAPKKSSAESLVSKEALQWYWQKVKRAGVKVKNNAVKWLKSVDFDRLKSQGRQVVAKVKKLIAGDDKPKAKAAKKSPSKKQEEQG